MLIPESDLSNIILLFKDECEQLILEADSNYSSDQLDYLYYKVRI